MHVINFTKLPPFSACNIENTREPGNEAINLWATQCHVGFLIVIYFGGGGGSGGVGGGGDNNVW